MVKKLSNNVRIEYILVALLLIFSGNPIIRFFGTPTVMILATIILFAKYGEIKKEFFTKFFVIASSLMVLFILQYFTLNFVSWLGAFRYMSLFLFGGLIFHLVGERFSFRYFIIIYYVSLISLVLFVIINLLNIRPPGLVWGDERLTYGIYTFVQEHRLRNSGMYWEPGAFAGILTLCMALNIKNLPGLWKTHKFKIIIIIAALLTTKSTTGYLVFFITVLFYILFFIKSSIIKIAIIPMLFIVLFIVYENTDFLQEKILTQSQKSAAIVKGEFTNSRFGSFKLDMHYVRKHPLVGNGLNEITRYADDPLLIQRLKAGENLANANGFSNFLACLGIPFMFFYFLSFFIAIGKVDLKLAFLVTVVVLLLLWGEQWLNFPLFTGLMFIKLNKYLPHKTLAKS